MKQRLVYLAVTLLCALTVSPIAVTWTYLPASAADEASPGARDGASPGDVVAGERLFETWCAGCHRPGGNRPDLVAPSGVGAGVAFETLLSLVRDGDDHAAPPGRYRPSELNDGQIRELAAYISASAGTSLPSENAEAAPAPVATATPVASSQPTGVPLATPGGACQGSGCPCRQTEPPRFVRAWGRDPSAPDQLRSPSGAAQAPDGTVYVVDATDDRVAYFDADGTFRGQWGTAGSGDGQFTSPTSVAVTADGQTVYVTDSGNQRVQVFDAAGTFLGAWAGRAATTGNSPAATPDWRRDRGALRSLRTGPST